MAKHRYGVPVGRSGCRFQVSNRGSFPLTTKGYGDAVRAAWAETNLGRANVGIDLQCGPVHALRRIPLAICWQEGHFGRATCETTAYPGREGERPIAGLRRRR